MPVTVAGLFRTRSEAQEALRKLKAAGFADGQVAVSTPTRRRHGDYLAKEVFGIGTGLFVGALLGALLGAYAAGRMPGSPMGTFIIAVFAGALTGGVAGGLFSMAASGDRALHYEQEVESGRILVSVAEPRLEQARGIMLAAGAIEAAPIEEPLESGRPRPEGG